MDLTKLIHEVWKDERTKELGLRKGEVKILVRVVADHIGKGLLQYGIIKIRDLFTLDIRKSKGRKIQNPQTKEEMYSKDSYKIGVKPSERMKRALKELDK